MGVDDIKNKMKRREVNARRRAFVWSMIGTIPILSMTMILPHVHMHAVDKFLSTMFQSTTLGLFVIVIIIQ